MPYDLNFLHNLPKTLEWAYKQEDDVQPSASFSAMLTLLDQRKLPQTLEYVTCTTVVETEEAIANMTVRGAPALGDCGAAAVAIWAANEWEGDDTDTIGFLHQLETVAAHVAQVRPTAVNLSWGANQIVLRVREFVEQGSMSAAKITESLCERVQEICEDDIASCRAIGENGSALFHELAQELGHPLRVETHCNAGSLATAYYGTATSVIYHAYAAGDIEKVWVDETRPVDQGARLTAWEMGAAGVPHTLICDDMAGTLMQHGEVDAVVVGADRICANGDTANKIGTYQLAVLANYHHVPFFIAAPQTTIDRSLATGEEIVIEERDAKEVRCFPHRGEWLEVAPEDVDVFNPGFDVTPRKLIRAIITDTGVE